MEKLKIAIQKSGRLSEKSMKLFEECGISMNNGKRKLVATSPDFPVEWLFLRDDDIPQYVYDGVADIGIVGENEVAEKGYEVKLVEKLGFARCKLSLAVPKEKDYSGLKWFDGKRVATSYPKILENYFSENNINAEIHQISGSVEISPAIGLADGIFDIVSSGSTLISNGLKEVQTVMKSEAVMIGKKGLSKDKSGFLEKLLFRVHATQKSRKNKYVVLNAPNDRLEEIIELIPGIKSPTVMRLADEGWSSVHSVLQEDEFWDVIDALKSKGAQGILVIPIEKMIV